MPLSDKQKEYVRESHHRYNIKTGATRAGKTYLDYYMIMDRIMELRGKGGLYVILGNTKGTIQRNIVEPMQAMYGANLVRNINSENTSLMFGEKVYCLGADKINQVNRIRGSSIKYCYGDEVATWNEEVFNMLHSRLDKPYSIFEGTCNPEHPTHWLKKFIDNEDPRIDKYHQHYTIFDNPFLSQQVKDALCAEYSGTVYYDRYILGKWTHAEGIIYRAIADDPERYTIKKADLPRLAYIDIGFDPGGLGSNHAIVATGFDSARSRLYVLKSRKYMAEGTDTQDVIDFIEKFVKSIQEEYRLSGYIYCDHIDMIINSLNRKGYRADKAVKSPINGRILALNRLLNADRVKFVEGENDGLIEALSNAVYDPKSEEDKRLDLCAENDQDEIDAFEYSWTYWQDVLISHIDTDIQGEKK